MKVLVTQSGLQHSHQLAWALEDSGDLVGFWTGVPVEDSRALGIEFWSRWGRSIRAVPVAAAHRRHFVFFPLFQCTLTQILPARSASALSHRICHAFDSRVARLVTTLRPDMVVCSENAALRTFQAAKRIGAICVLDAASVHFDTQRQQLTSLGLANPKWVDDRKQQEIELADAILTCSELAASTYVAGGVPAAKLVAVPLGADLPANELTKREASEVVRFVYVGSLRALKGIDLLLDIFEQFQKDALPVHLTLIGGVAEGELGVRASRIANVTLKPFTAHPAVFEEMVRHDLLLLPSRFDSFGMVVAEAMAVGVPALVTDRVGAKCIIEQHPDAGWIVPCDADALMAQMLWLVDHRAELTRASDAARRAAQDYTWSNYRHRVVSALEGIYTRCRA